MTSTLRSISAVRSLILRDSTNGNIYLVVGEGMDQACFNGLLEGLEDERRWLIANGLAGTSKTLREFAGAVTRSRQEVVFPSNGPSGVVAITRCSDAPRLDAGLLSLLGLSADCPNIVDLSPGADVFNQGCLFGIGRRPGVFEVPSGSAIIVRGLEHLSPTALQRLNTHIEAWGAHNRAPIVLLGVPHDNLTTLLKRLEKSRSVVYLALTPLCNRRDDIPWAVHEAARQYAGGLDQFELDAVNLLATHPWPGDLREVDGVVRGIYGPLKQDTATQVQATDVREAITGWNNRRSLMTSTAACSDVVHLWYAVQRMIGDIDRRTAALLGIPFFSADSVPAQGDPLAGAWPELNFLRLVSWAYVKYIEAAEPNLRCILKLFSGLLLQVDRAEEIRAAIVSLRTFSQHHLQYSSEHDQGTIERACSWFERSVGRRQPEEEDFEHCIRYLLVDVIALLEAITTFLQRVERDDFREVILSQWRRMRDTQWEKHRFEAIVGEALPGLGRDDLDVRVVTERLLREMQQHLSAATEEVDKERMLRSLVERRVAEEFPRQMPVDGKDIIRLGVPPSEAVRHILDRLRAHFLQTNAGREELLSMAADLIHELHKPGDVGAVGS